MEIRGLRRSYDEMVQSWIVTMDKVLVQLKDVIHSKPLTGRIYIWAQVDGLLINPRTDFRYTVALINPDDNAVSTSMPFLTVTLARGGEAVYSREIAFNITGPITLGPREERIIYHETIMLSESVQKGIYCLQAEAKEEVPPETRVFETVPTLVMLT